MMVLDLENTPLINTPLYMTYADIWSGSQSKSDSGSQRANLSMGHLRFIDPDKLSHQLSLPTPTNLFLSVSLCLILCHSLSPSLLLSLSFFLSFSL